MLDDNWGRFKHRVEVQTLDLLKPAVIKSLQKLLAGYPDWEIVVAVDIPEKKDVWPGMGLVIAENEIVDELEREYLPREFKDLMYEGSRRSRSLFDDPS